MSFCLGNFPMTFDGATEIQPRFQIGIVDVILQGEVFWTCNRIRLQKSKRYAQTLW